MSFKVKDHYFKKAKQENFLARSVYKLEEIDKKFQVLHDAQMILDLGYHPGSWTQYCSKIVGSAGKVVGIDIRELNSKLALTPNIELFEMDINDVSGPADFGLSEKFDVVVSDMAPNTTGIKSVDQDRSLNLVEMAFYLLPKTLKVGGNFVIKVFDSNDAQVFIKENKHHFQETKLLKPKSTRSVSKEFFLIGKNYLNP